METFTIQNEITIAIDNDEECGYKAVQLTGLYLAERPYEIQYQNPAETNWYYRKEKATPYCTVQSALLLPEYGLLLRLQHLPLLQWNQDQDEYLVHTL